MKILVTGAKGFIGKNLTVALKQSGAHVVWEFDVDCSHTHLVEWLSEADAVYHLAGVNRPERVEEFREGNTDFTREVCDLLRNRWRKPLLVLTSSIQAILENPYGVSKRKAEEIALGFGSAVDADVVVFRLPGVFGKWCRPNYNSVVATFCHNISRNIPIHISDPARELELVYIDDVVHAFSGLVEGQRPASENGFYLVEPTYRITLGRLADTIRSFRESRQTLLLSDFTEPLNRCLYATYLSYLPTTDFAYHLLEHADPRGELAELLKSPHLGQIFVSRTRPGVTRGNHHHSTKAEKFVVLKGDAVIRFRHILEEDVIEYPISGEQFNVVDIPPGYTHSIENVGQEDLIVLFWANEIFDVEHPDTVFEKVIIDA